MIVWLVDSLGPGHHSGVTDDLARARGHAEKLLADGQAISARVESASANPSGWWLRRSAYERSGIGWAATRAPDGSVSWSVLPSLAAAS